MFVRVTFFKKEIKREGDKMFNLYTLKNWQPYDTHHNNDLAIDSKQTLGLSLVTITLMLKASSLQHLITGKQTREADRSLLVLSMFEEQPKRKKALADGCDSLYAEVHIEVFFNNQWTLSYFKICNSQGEWWVNARMSSFFHSHPPLWPIVCFCFLGPSLY